MESVLSDKTRSELEAHRQVSSLREKMENMDPLVAMMLSQLSEAISSLFGAALGSNEYEDMHLVAEGINLATEAPGGNIVPGDYYQLFEQLLSCDEVFEDVVDDIPAALATMMGIIFLVDNGVES